MKQRSVSNALFKEDEVSNLEDKLTNSSIKSHKGLKTGGSISTVLSQALVSEDV